MPTRESITTVESMLEVPNDPVSQPQDGVARKDRVHCKIKRDYLSLAINEIAQLPTNATTRFQNTNALGYDGFLLHDVIPERLPFLVALADVVGRRSNY